jgi:hypothetical protein
MMANPRSCFRSSDYLLFTIVSALSVLAILPPAIAEEANTRAGAASLFGALIKATDASTVRLNELESAGTNTVVFTLNSSDDKAKKAIRAAAANAERVGLAFAYWIEVARSPELADLHPEWMASLQTHDEWRRFFPNAPRPKANEVVKTYPWVPILSRETFNAQRERVLTLLANADAKADLSERLARSALSLRLWQSTLSVDKRLWHTSHDDAVGR